MSASLRKRFWLRTRSLSMGLLGAWLLVSLLVPWFARDLDRFEVFGFPLGWWMAAEGALLVYLVLIVVDVVAMERLEAAWHAARPGPGDEPDDEPTVEPTGKPIDAPDDVPATGGVPGSA